MGLAEISKAILRRSSVDSSDGIDRGQPKTVIGTVDLHLLSSSELEESWSPTGYRCHCEE